MIPALPLSMVSSRPRRARERKAREDALAQEVPNGRPAGIHWRVFLLKDIYNKKALKSHRFEKVWLSVARRSVGWIFQIWICPWGLSNISIYIHISLYIYIPFWRHFWVDDFPFPKWDMFPKRLSWPVAQLGRNMWIWKSLNLTQPCPNSHWNTKAAKKEVAILELNLSYLAGVCYKNGFQKNQKHATKIGWNLFQP